MSAPHSPLPWRVEPGRIDGRPVIYDATGYPVAALHSNGDPAGMDRTRSGQRTADAALIAAAPELLAALREIRAVCSTVRPFANAAEIEASVASIRRVGKFIAACEHADAAIAKATA
jgi:hypothetical protein